MPRPPIPAPVEFGNVAKREMSAHAVGPAASTLAPVRQLSAKLAGLGMTGPAQRIS